MTQPAKVLAPADVRRVQARVRRGCFALRNHAVVLLSYKCGLRACEIAGLTWSMVLTPRGRVSAALRVAGRVAKNGRGRTIPMHPELRAALEALHKERGRPRDGAVISSQRGGHMRPRSIVNWFGALYAELGLHGCSSHSGRRTFATRAAKAISKAGGSLRDVQELLGHAALSTTQAYLEGDRDAQRRVVRML